MTDRHGIGGNAPPASEAFALEVEELFALISGSTSAPVTTDEQEQALDDLLDQVRRARKDGDAIRADEKRPHDEAAKAIQAKWKPLLDRCDAGAEAIKAALTPYRTAKQKAKDVAATKARDEAAAKLVEAQAALKASDDLESRFAAEEALKQAGKLAKVADRIDREATGLRTFWEAEITDRRACLKHYITHQPEAFEALLQGMADKDARGSRAPVPGVKFIERKVAV